MYGTHFLLLKQLNEGELHKLTLSSLWLPMTPFGTMGIWDHGTLGSWDLLDHGTLGQLDFGTA